MLETLKARKEALEARGEKGFTLMEMLIVIAIIAILIAIAIPVFTAQLERAGEATDAANARAGYAEVMANYITNPTDSTNNKKSYKLQQGQASWQNADIKSGLEALKVPRKSGGLGVSIVGEPKQGGNVTVAYNGSAVTITF